MKPLLVVVDMQIDFISGALGTKEAETIVPAVIQRIREFPGIPTAQITCPHKKGSIYRSSTVSAGLRAGRFILMSYRLDTAKQ